jgi:hypothetical protein
MRADPESPAAFARSIAKLRPAGQITWAIYRPSVHPLSQKYSGFPKTQFTLTIAAVLPTEGRLAIVTDAGQDAVDADVPLTNGA